MTEAIARGDTRIEREALAAAGLNHDGAAPERFMPQLSEAVLAARFAASALEAHAANPLIAALDAAGDLGATLGPDQVTAVLGIVAMLEGAPQQTQLMP